MKTILVVDDEPKIVALARDYLEHAGFGVLTAVDGRSALETVKRGATPTSWCWTSGLPRLDGLDVTREIRRDLAPADRDAHRPRRRAGQAPGPGAGRRRLPHQAVQPARAGRPRQGRPPPHGGGRRARPRCSGAAT